MKSYRLSAEAQHDLQEIGHYIAANASLERALNVVSTIGDEFLKIAETPGIGHFKEEVASKELKFWSVYRYLIAYRWDQNPIEIVAVVHGNRDLTTFFESRRY